MVLKSANTYTLFLFVMESRSVCETSNTQQFSCHNLPDTGIAQMSYRESSDTES